MNSEKIAYILMLVVAIVGTFVQIPMQGLILLLIGLVSGVINPLTEISDRTAYLILALAAPTVANSLDMIPEIGAYLNAIVDSIAITAGGMWLASFTRALIGKVV